MIIVRRTRNNRANFNLIPLMIGGLGGAILWNKYHSRGKPRGSTFTRKRKTKSGKVVVEQVRKK